MGLFPEMAHWEIFSAQLQVLLQGTQHMNLNDKLGCPFAEPGLSLRLNSIP